MVEKRYYTVVLSDETELGRYHGNPGPRNAALKVAKKVGATEEDPIEFTIRELGTQKYHTYSGFVEERPRTDADPDWVGDVVHVAKVKKIGYENRGA